jgi:hypothetical protein
MRRATLTACFLALPILAVSSYLYLEDRAVRKIEVETRALEAEVISQAIHRYTVDMGTPPRSLDDLVVAGYLKAIPGRGPVYYDPIMPPPKQSKKLKIS